MMPTLSSENLELAPALTERGLSLRNWRDDADYDSVSRVLIASRNADDMPEGRTGDDLRSMYTRIKNFVATRDLFLVEHSGKLVGYAGGKWSREPNDMVVYRQWIDVLPEWRGRGIEAALLVRLQEHQRSLHEKQMQGTLGWFEIELMDSQTWLTVILQPYSYEPFRHFYSMVRENLENIPDAALPAGIEVRPVTPAQMRQIFVGGEEAFTEHGADPVVDEEDFQLWLKRPWNPALWQIAWEGDKVVGMVLNHIDESENKKYGYLRGHTEDIAVRKPWRGRGVAKALLVRSLKMFRDMGFDSTALGVDTNNATGALRLYESVGYKTVRRSTEYRLQM